MGLCSKFLQESGLDVEYYYFGKNMFSSLSMMILTDLSSCLLFGPSLAKCLTFMNVNHFSFFPVAFFATVCIMAISVPLPTPMKYYWFKDVEHICNHFGVGAFALSN